MKYFVYELHVRTQPFHAEFYGYLIYNKTQNQVGSIIVKETQREARKRCNEILDIASQYDNSIVVWRNWPIVISREDDEETILNTIKEREIQWGT